MAWHFFSNGEPVKANLARALGLGVAPCSPRLPQTASRRMPPPTSRRLQISRSYLAQARWLLVAVQNRSAVRLVLSTSPAPHSRPSCFGCDDPPPREALGNSFVSVYATVASTALRNLPITPLCRTGRNLDHLSRCQLRDRARPSSPSRLTLTSRRWWRTTRTSPTLTGSHAT